MHTLLTAMQAAEAEQEEAGVAEAAEEDLGAEEVDEGVTGGDSGGVAAVVVSVVVVVVEASGVEAAVGADFRCNDLTLMLRNSRAVEIFGPDLITHAAIIGSAPDSTSARALNQQITH